MCRNNSVRELGLFTETANAVNRLLLSHLSISEAYPPTPIRTCSDDEQLDDTALLDSTEVVFQLDLSSDESDSSFRSFRRRDKKQPEYATDEALQLSSPVNPGISTSLRSRRSLHSALQDELEENSVKEVHSRLRETQLSGDSGFVSGDMLSSLMLTPPTGGSTTG